MIRLICVAIGYLFNMVFNQYKADGDLARAHRLIRARKAGCRATRAAADRFAFETA